MTNQVEAVGAFTVNEFCDAYRISKPKFYRMVHDGTAPKSIMLNSTRRIPYSAAREWEEKYLADSAISPDVSADRRKRAMGNA